MSYHPPAGRRRIWRWTPASTSPRRYLGAGPRSTIPVCEIAPWHMILHFALIQVLWSSRCNDRMLHTVVKTAGGWRGRLAWTPDARRGQTQHSQPPRPNHQVTAAPKCLTANSTRPSQLHHAAVANSAPSPQRNVCPNTVHGNPPPMHRTQAQLQGPHTDRAPKTTEHPTPHPLPHPPRCPTAAARRHVQPPRAVRHGR